MHSNTTTTSYDCNDNPALGIKLFIFYTFYQMTKHGETSPGTSHPGV